MIWAALAAFAVLAMAPVAWSLRRGPTWRGRREAALALHRAQLAELERDLCEGRLAAAEHASAVLELQRRLLAAAELPDAAAEPDSRWPVLATVVGAPIAAILLYALSGSPSLPDAPLAARIELARQQAAEEASLLDALRARLATLDPRSEQARQGYVLLGGAEARRRNLQEAAEAWRMALAARFDPTLAAEAAEAMTEAQGQVTKEAADLFRRALETAPQDAPWRPMAEKRLAQAGAS